MASVKRIEINGYRSIKALSLELRPLNVIIGANGAGKSNLVSFFKMLNEMMGGRLQQYIAGSGRAHSLLHYGPKMTPQLDAKVEFETDDGANDVYAIRLFHAAEDTMIFAEENLQFQKKGAAHPALISLGSGHQETRLGVTATQGNRAANVFWHLLNRCRVYHFHDTSLEARVRQYGYVGNARWLMPDAGNLAAFLFRLRQEREAGNTAYDRIVSTVRLIAPFFDDFQLAPAGAQKNDIILNWREKDSADIFGPHQLSDGTLRAICLTTLLLQPEKELPDLIIVDEPELGLHPYALTVIASLFKKAAHHRQVLIGTQSAALLDEFEPEDVIVADREGGSSQFKRLEREPLLQWLEDYSLGEIWAKNIIPGGPH